MPTILCIDDNRTGLATRKALLTSMGYGVLTAEHAMSGLALLLTRFGVRCGFCEAVGERIDAVVLDYRMPGMDGEAVAGIIRNEQPDVPIVLLTAVPQDFLPSNLMASVDTVIAKGEPPQVLLTALERLTGTTQRKPPAKISPVIEEARKLQDKAKAIRGEARSLRERQRQQGA